MKPLGKPDWIYIKGEERRGLQSVTSIIKLHIADASITALMGFPKRSRDDLGSKVVLVLMNYTLRMPFWELSWPRLI